MGSPWRTCDESGERLPADPLGGGIGRDQLGMGGFELLQFAVEGVVVGVGDLGGVEHVVAILVMPDQLAELRQPPFHVRRPACARGVDSATEPPPTPRGHPPTGT